MQKQTDTLQTQKHLQLPSITARVQFGIELLVLISSIGTAC